MDEKRFLATARPLMSLPTAPLHEHFALQAVRAHAACRPYLEVEEDASGNLLLVYTGRPDSPENPAWVVATAHLDHPGLAFKERGGGRACVFERLGGVDVEKARLTGVRIYSLDKGAGQRPLRGRIAAYDAHEEVFEVCFDSAGEAGRLGRGTFAMWDLPPFRRRGRRLHARACDDLAGAAVGLCFLDELHRRRAPVRAGLLLTRAEEIGFVGMLAALRDGFVRPGALYINIECSSALAAGAALGGGPVVRVGDRSWVFDPHLSGGLSAVAAHLQNRHPTFRFQRKLMDGGSCEATALMNAGFPVGAVALPLGNYHNTGARALQPEIIHLDDALGLVELLVHLARHPGGVENALESATRQLKDRLAARLERYAARLRKEEGP